MHAVSGTVSVTLSYIEQNPKWSINFIKNHKYETFMKIRPVRMAMIDKDVR